MANDKKFYWIKLKTDFFNLDEIDFLLSQKNGCEYIVLYQMLCLKTANNNGRLCTEIGEIIIPYDIDKIVRETKYFDFDTVTVALELFKKLGLIFEQEDHILKISAIDTMVGSETSSAERVRKHRKQKVLQCNTDVTNKMLQSNIDKEKDIRDKSKDIDTEKEKKRIKETTLDIYNRLIPNYILSDDIQSKMREWLQYKAERKEPYMETGLKSLLRQIESNALKFGDTAICNLIDECMANNWKGIIFDRLKAEKPKAEKGRLDWIDEIQFTEADNDISRV